MILTQSAPCITGDTLLYYHESNVQRTSGLVSNSQHHVSPVIHCPPIIRVSRTDMSRGILEHYRHVQRSEVCHDFDIVLHMVVISRATQACCNEMVVIEPHRQKPSCQKPYRHVQRYSRALQTCLEVFCMILTQSAPCITGDTLLYYHESNVQRTSGLVSNSQHHVSPVIHCPPIIRVMQNFIVYSTEMVVISRATQACCNAMVVMSKAIQTCLEVFQSITDMSRGLQHDFDTVRTMYHR